MIGKIEGRFGTASEFRELRRRLLIAAAAFLFGEFVADPAVRAFTIFLLVMGLGVAAVFATTAAGLVIDGYLGHVFWKRRMERQAGRLSNHYVVCGHGEAALHALGSPEDAERARSNLGVSLAEAGA